MKKLFVSLPMLGRPDDVIKDEMMAICQYISEMLDEPFELIDSMVHGNPPDDANISAWYLGNSIVKLSGADLAVFHPDWVSARGCIIEHMVCAMYGVSYIELEPNEPDEFEDFEDDINDYTHDWNLAGEANAILSETYSEAVGMKQNFEDALGFEHDDVDDLVQEDPEEVDISESDKRREHLRSFLNRNHDKTVDPEDELEPGEYDADAETPDEDDQKE